MARGSALRNLPYRRSSIAARHHDGSGHKTAILLALAGNVVIAIAKLFAGLATGSAAMLSEAAHSSADCINEILLGVALGRSRRPADQLHPFGYGRERFLWSFVAALSSFLIGGCVSIGLAIHQFSEGRPSGHQLAAWIVLAIALIADGASFVQGFAQAKEQASEQGITTWQYLVRSSDPILRAIVVEDVAALVGTLLAAAGLFLSTILQNRTPDSIASLLIGALLAVTALGLARPLAAFLIGRSLPEPLLEKIQQIIVECSSIEELIGLQAVYVGPEEAIVAAKAYPKQATIEVLAAAMDELDHRIKAAVPVVADVFIDITTPRAPAKSK